MSLPASCPHQTLFRLPFEAHTRSTSQGMARTSRPAHPEPQSCERQITTSVAIRTVIKYARISKQNLELATQREYRAAHELFGLEQASP